MAKLLSTTPRQKIIITTGLTTLITLALITFITWPSMDEIKKLNEQIYQQRTELEALYQKGQVMRKTLKDYAEIKPTIKNLDAIYIQPGEELKFITSLEGVADTNGVEQDIKLGAPETSGADIKPLPITLNLKGNLYQIIHYLTGIEALDYYINLDTLRLNSNLGDRNSTADLKLNAILLANTYIKP